MINRMFFEILSHNVIHQKIKKTSVKTYEHKNITIQI